MPKLSSGSGRAAAGAVLEQLRSWGCDSHIVGMCFDTIAANTGRINGACHLLEDAVGKNLLWLACRHHILEILLSDVFTACFGASSSGPDIPIFKRFRDCWHKLNHQQPAICFTPLMIAPDVVNDLISQQLQQTHARNDYLELLHLAGRLIGHNVATAVRKPGPIHRARWMAKAICGVAI